MEKRKKKYAPGLHLRLKLSRETGLGAGSDFQCTFDESPRDGGCQIKCDGRSCERAQAKCRSLGHCVSVDVNRDKTWATLKSLQAVLPPP